MDMAGIRVLVVEDEAMIAMLYESVLEDMGCEVVGVSGRLEDAKEKAGRLAIDVALLDVNLAGQMSYPVAAVLRERGIPFVFATGYGAGALPPELHGTPVLRKPFPWPDLAAALSLARDRCDVST